MKIPPIFEQSICIILLLSIQKEHTVLSTQLISTRLQLSNTYTKKITNKLVKNGLLESVPGKYGGLKILKNIDQITLLNIYEAVVGKPKLFTNTNLAERVFIDPSVVREKQKILQDKLDFIQNTFFADLEAFTLDKLWTNKDYLSGYINWETISNTESELQNEKRN